MLSFVFVGGGYAGVEALAELEDLVRDTKGFYPGLADVETRWILVEATEGIFPEIGHAWAPTRCASSSSAGFSCASAPPSTTRAEEP